MTKEITGPQAQLNLSVVALVALVAIVGLVALVLNSPLMGAQASYVAPTLESAAEVNAAGEVFHRSWAVVSSSGGDECGCGGEFPCAGCATVGEQNACRKKCKG